MKIILVASPRALLGLKKPPKCPKMAKNDTFSLIIFDPSIAFLKLGQNVEAIVPNIKPLSQTLAKFWLASPGLLGLKSPLFGVVFLICRIIDMCVFRSSGFLWC